MQLSKQQFMAALGISSAVADKFLAPLNATLTKYQINTPRRLAHFLAQIGHESNSLAAERESLNYTVEALLRTFGRHRISAADAGKFGRIEGKQPANQSAIANLVYGGDWGAKNLGNTQTGDGWKFRGGGPMQLTGRTNYTATGRALAVDLAAQPELIAAPENYMHSAGEFWKSRKLNAFADLDKGETPQQSAATVLLITKVINGGTNGLADRQQRFLRAITALASLKRVDPARALAA